MPFAIIRFYEELGDQRSDKPDFTGTAFVGVQSTIRNFTIAEDRPGDGYLLLSVAGMQNAEAQVMAFADEKDTAGNLLHPNFAEVRVVMGSLIAANLDLDVQTAYDNAVWANPNLRKSALAKQRAVPGSKPGKLKKTKPAKEPSLRDMVTEAVRHDTERAGA